MAHLDLRVDSLSFTLTVMMLAVFFRILLR